ncbi:YoaK family protein [Bacillus benzoevorans]|uniref:Uncharacterized membrane protein YoaK (UPF0700 family) n=1 Tax=Bacillus benzoevorans TaxID=1456 RepID=A0A7X0LVA3_9BACI|nr:YoaK family protein [Bacillus benzoevorans]MBB6444357.1 uncharacterized membrane protein YoaK (UPF0700 family) [Bacillus benzoevorans]
MERKHKNVISLSSNSAILGMLLAVVGGFLDAYTFISRDGVFANAQSGNMVLFAVNAVNQEWDRALLFLSPIIAFIAGVIVSEVVKKPRLREILYSYRRSILILEFIILVMVGTLPENIPDIVVIVCISFVSSLQISTFNKVEDWAYNSTMTTGNLRTAVQAAYALLIEQKPEAKKQLKDFSLIILSFLFGASAGTFFTIYIGNTSIWIAGGIIFAALILYHRDKGYFRKPMLRKTSNE